MKVVYTDEALRDLDDVLTFIGLNYPTVVMPFQERLRTIEWRIGRWPKSAAEVKQRPGVHAVPFIRYPYRLFYRIAGDAVEIRDFERVTQGRQPTTRVSEAVDATPLVRF